MSDADQADTIQHLRTENARLRHLLEQRGVPSTLRHQVRNALGLMRAIARRSAESKATIEDFVAHLDGRFDALLRVQTALLSSPDNTVELTKLVADELLAQIIREGERATIIGPTLHLEARQAELIGLVLHELATNAIKFGALTVPQGHIEVSWAVSPPRRLTITWAENGPSGPSSSFRGFGMEAIEGMLPYQLKAESRLEFLSEGLRCTIALPLAPAP